MGTRYHVPVKCQCGFEGVAWYAPTSGFMDWRCPTCGTVIDLEAETGIDAESTASTPGGAEYVRSLKGAGAAPTQEEK